MNGYYREIKSFFDWFSPIELHKPSTAFGPTHCARAKDMSIQPIQVEGIRSPIQEAEMSNRLLGNLDHVFTGCSHLLSPGFIVCLLF